MSTEHLTDDDLAGLALELGSDPVRDAHLRTCGWCLERQQALSAMLEQFSAAAAADADAVFPPERLAQQRARLLRRLAQEGRPGRVLAFPAPSRDRRVFRPRPTTRWIAAAAAAGMAIGLVVGRFSHHPAAPSLTVGRSAHLAAAPPARTVGLAPAGAVLSDDELMGEIELAVARPWPGLEPIHALTPR